MHRPPVLLLLAALLATLLAFAPNARAQGSEGETEIPIAVLVQALDKGQITTQDKLATAGFPVVPVKDFPLFDISLYGFTAPLTAADIPLIRGILDDLIASGDILNGDFDVRVSVERGSGQTGSLWVTCLGPAEFDGQYGLALTGAYAAADRGHGRDVVVAVIDSGIVPTAPLVGDFALPFGYDFVAANGFVPFVPVDSGDGVDNNTRNGIDESVGHGSFVSGLISRVAPGARHLHMKVLDSDGDCVLSDVIAALQACQLEGVHVVNMSLIPSQPTNTLAAVIQSVHDNGAILVASAGNTAGIANRYLNSEPYLVQVGATDWSDAVWENSATGAWVDVFAPGVTTLDAAGMPIPGTALVSPIGLDPVTSLPCYAAASGTSFSAAWVSGAAACFRAANPSWPDAIVAADAIAPRFTLELQATATTSSTAGVKRLDAAALTALYPGVAHCRPDIVPSYFPQTGLYNPVIDGADLGALLSSWGYMTDDPRQINRFDLTGDNFVNAADLAILLGFWGQLPYPPCP